MADQGIPARLSGLHAQELCLRQKATELVEGDGKLVLHLAVIEHAMDLADMLRQFPTEDEDLKVVKILGMRMFNAFGASVKLALSGYSQNSALIMRDILETVFLVDLFKGDRAAITRWRLAEKKERMDNFRPVRVREALDERGGFNNKKRAEHYDLFSELAGHPNMRSVLMMRPQRKGDAVIGPFIERGTLEAVLSEMGRLAVIVGENLDAFFPNEWEAARAARQAFAQLKRRWVATFYKEGEGAAEVKGA